MKKLYNFGASVPDHCCPFSALKKTVYCLLVFSSSARKYRELIVVTLV